MVRLEGGVLVQGRAEEGSHMTLQGGAKEKRKVMNVPKTLQKTWVLTYSLIIFIMSHKVPNTTVSRIGANSYLISKLLYCAYPVSGRPQEVLMEVERQRGYSAILPCTKTSGLLALLELTHRAAQVHTIVLILVRFVIHY